MADLIERKDVLELVKNYKDRNIDCVAIGSGTAKARLMGKIRELPQADTERHAHWVFDSEYGYLITHKCSKCGQILTIMKGKELKHYCCNCGCKMDEVVGNE